MADDESITPPETAERVLFRIQAAALVKVLGRKKARVYLHAMAEALREGVTLAEVTPIRAGAGAPAKRAATQEALEILRHDLPVLWAGMPR
jgi:hypothetical protein